VVDRIKYHVRQKEMPVMMRSTVRLALLPVALLAMASCTHNPMTNERAFNNFSECMGANIALGGLGVVAQRKISNGIGLSKNEKNIGTALVAGGLLYQAWQNCAAVYLKTNETNEISREALIKAGHGTIPKNLPALRLTGLQVVAMRPGEPIATHVSYQLWSDKAEKKDIPVTLRRILTVAAQPPVPLINVPEQKINQQGERTAHGEIPTPPELGVEFKPDQVYQFQVELESEGLKVSEMVAFRFDGKTYSAPITRNVIEPGQHQGGGKGSALPPGPKQKPRAQPKPAGKAKE
jgi:hypothetical protein